MTISRPYLNASALSGFSLLHYNNNNNFKTMVAIDYKLIVEMSVRVLVSVYQLAILLLKL